MHYWLLLRSVLHYWLLLLFMLHFWLIIFSISIHDCMKLVSYLLSKSNFLVRKIMLCFFDHHRLCSPLQLVLRLDHIALLKYALLLVLVLLFNFACILYDDGRAIQTCNHVFYVMTLLKLLAWIWRFNKGSLPVSKLAE